MRVVMLGGAGDMGAEAVRDLVQYGPFDEIVIADRNVVGAEKLASELNDRRVSVIEVDATKHAELVKLLAGQQCDQDLGLPGQKFIQQTGCGIIENIDWQ